VSVRQKEGSGKNTTRVGGDFSAVPERPGLAFARVNGVIFAPEIRQKHTGALIKSKREAIGILGINGSQEECRQSGVNYKRCSRKFNAAES
jgi:hypothetical protein